MTRVPRTSLSVPRAPLLLGGSGLVPFLALALLLWLLPAHSAPAALALLIGYGAVILSFVGALAWGIALVHPEMGEREQALVMTWSVVPAFAGWVALALPPPAGLPLLVAMFALQLGADHRLAARFPVPRWFLPLRNALTAGAVASLLLALLFVLSA